MSGGKIPSTSWSHIAGNRYRSDHSFGSLVLGGFDSSKFVANEVIFPINSSSQRDLTAQLEDIVVHRSDNSSASLLLTSISTFVDSSQAYFWLSSEACAMFEKEFGLNWNETAELYLLNSTQHTILLDNDASISFSLNNPSGGAKCRDNPPIRGF